MILGARYITYYRGWSTLMTLREDILQIIVVASPYCH